MTDATTPNFSWSYPTNGADASTWGSTLNATILAIDSVIATMMPKGGGTFSGSCTFNNGVTFGDSVTFGQNPSKTGGGKYLYYGDSGNSGGAVTVSASGPSGTRANGDIWMQHS